jgi:hypothetical protein
MEMNRDLWKQTPISDRYGVPSIFMRQDLSKRPPSPKLSLLTHHFGPPTDVVGPPTASVGDQPPKCGWLFPWKKPRDPARGSSREGYPELLLHVVHVLVSILDIQDPQQIVFLTRNSTGFSVARRMKEHRHPGQLEFTRELSDRNGQNVPWQVFGIRDDDADAVQEFREIKPEIGSVDDQQGTQFLSLTERVDFELSDQRSLTVGAFK